ncbi:hypothetical protein J6590_063341 [Homalodisca vitripennis]|nr:hypothetical protein J6590_063341 [Homalodisca vitripennis]
MQFEKTTRKFNKVHWKSRDGESGDQHRYFMSMDSGSDANHTFTSAGLVVMSSADILQDSGSGFCDTEDELPCDLSSCYFVNQTCDGVQDCVSGIDELMCPNLEKEEFEYKISRSSRTEFLYDMKEADWGWREIKVNDHEGVEFEPLTAPATADDWYFTAFSINTDLGFSMIPEPFIARAGFVERAGDRGGEGANQLGHWGVGGYGIPPRLAGDPVPPGNF